MLRLLTYGFHRARRPLPAANTGPNLARTLARTPPAAPPAGPLGLGSTLALALFFLLAGSTSPAPASAAPPQRSPWAASQAEDLVISLATFSPGVEIHTYWGHDAMVVSDPRRGIEIMYNFGTFDVGPDMLANYLQGQLTFWVSRTPVMPVYQSYEVENRDVRVRDLNLTPGQARKLADRLEWYAQPDNRRYLYHHYVNNCTTKLRDLLDEALDGAFHAQYTKPARLNFRHHTMRYTERLPPLEWLLILAMNDQQERPLTAWDEGFLPDELERMVEETTVMRNGKAVPLVRETRDIYLAERRAVPETPAVFWPYCLGTGLLLGLIALVLGEGTRRKSRAARVGFGLYHFLIGVAFGLPSLIIFLLLFTDWTVTHHNENLWLANPLLTATLLLGLPIAAGSRRALRWMRFCFVWLTLGGVLAVLLKALPMFDQDNWAVLTLLLPLHGAFLFAHQRLRPTRST